MLKATVTGRIWSTKKLSEVPAGSILEVEVDETSSRLLAFDPLGCGDGEKVIVATGSVAAGWFPGKSPPIDALIIGSIDERGHQVTPLRSTEDTMEQCHRNDRDQGICRRPGGGRRHGQGRQRRRSSAASRWATASSPSSSTATSAR